METASSRHIPYESDLDAATGALRNYRYASLGSELTDDVERALTRAGLEPSYVFLSGSGHEVEGLRAGTALVLVLQSPRLTENELHSHIRRYAGLPGINGLVVLTLRPLDGLHVIKGKPVRYVPLCRGI